MSDNRHRRIEALFHAALDRPANARSAFVDDACGGDTELRRAVLSLLTADESRNFILDVPVCDSVLQSASTRSLMCGQRVGAYEIVRLVGAGGMGNVYEATQDRPHRSVALKLLRTAIATDSEQRRFEYESELLGRLVHPNIASIHEAGIHTDGPLRVPYYAMEYIAGSQNLLQYARSHELSVRRRLEMCLDVCNAVQYGHQKGIVHRDLKPGNILVDDAGVPKVIDYGVARALDRDGPLSTVRTSVDAFIGTLQYMSPEQLASENGEVDTRSDVYALGLILFELLADRRPYDFGATTLSAAVRAIESLPCPSLGSIRGDLQGDLSTITAKAMAKERDRRYQSPSELAADIRRYLRNEPILASPPSLSYRLRKYAARNKTVVASVIIVALSVVAGLGVAGWQFKNATDERDRARVEARKAERISAFLQEILASADPRSSTVGVTIHEALDRAAATVESDLGDEPQVYADVQALIGSIYERLGDHAHSEQHLRAALETRRTLFGDDSCDVANTLSDLSWAVGVRDSQEQETLLREAMNIYRAMYGDADPTTAVQESYLAGCLVDRSDHVEAEPLIRDAIATLRSTREEEDSDLAFALKVLAQCLQGQARTGEADTAYREALDLHRQVYPPDHYELGLMLGSFANFLSKTNRPDEAAIYRVEADRISAMRVGEGVSCDEMPESPDG